MITKEITMRRARYVIVSILCFTVIALSGCGRGGDTAAPSPPPPDTILNGMVSKGPIRSATVTLFNVSFGAMDAASPLGQGQTGDNGNFSVDIVSSQGPAVVEVTGGSFTDEVSGLSVNLNAPLHTVVPVVPAESITTVATTPLTELAFRKAKGSGLTAESISSANASIAATFGLRDIVSTLPTPNGETIDQKKYATACGAFSQLVNDNKGAGETLDDALSRLMTQMGDEMEASGKLSTDSIVMINRAIATFSSSVSNATGATLDTLPLPTSGLLRLTATGAPASIFGIDTTISLPPGVILDSDPVTGQTADGVVTISGVAAVGSNTLSVAKFTPAAIGTPAQVHIVLLNSSGFGLGEFLTIQFNTTAGATFPLSSQFSVVSFFAKGSNGAGLAGVGATPSVEGI